MSDLVLLLVEWLSSHQMMLNNSAFPGEAAVKRKVDKKISNSKVIAIKGRSAIFFPNVIIVTIKIWKKSTFLNWLHLEKVGMPVYVYFLLIPAILKKENLTGYWEKSSKHSNLHLFFIVFYFIELSFYNCQKKLFVFSMVPAI